MPTESFVHEKTNITYYHCVSCECIFKSPEYYQDFESQKERYNLHENNEEDVGYQAYFRRFLDFVLPYTGEPKCALDFGCGTTTLLAQMMATEGIQADAYDPIYHPEGLDEDQQYELIVSTEVFEHLHDPRKVFEMLCGHLERGGYIALQTQFHPNVIEAFKTWYYHQDPTHIVFFTPKTFKVLAEQCGCSYIADNMKNMIIIQKS